jgi:acetyltransferase
MSVRNLPFLLHPSSIALIGASTRPGSVGAVIAQNLFHSGFDGPVMPVNPRARSVEGVLAYPDVASLPLVPDLAVICTPPDSIPGLVAELAARGTKAAVVITAGLGQPARTGPGSLRQQMLDAARPHLMRIIGPNCLGIMIPGAGVNASFAHCTPPKGGIAFVTQSGAMVTAVLDWSAPRGIGFSHVVSLGDMADVDFGDMLDYLATDASTHAVLLYIEAVTNARKFMSAARACARLKPIIVIKAGRHAAGARAAASHTGAMAGSDAVYDAAFRRAGILRVRQLQELFDAVVTLSTARPVSGGRLAILTNGGGPGVLAIDALIDAGGIPAELSPATLQALDAVLPATWSRGNPIDIIGDAPGERFGKTLDVLLQDPDNDAVLVLDCPTAIASSTDAARAVIASAANSKRPILTSWLGEPAAQEARALFAQERIPTYPTPEEAVNGFMHLVRHRHNQDLLIQAPPSIPEEFVPDRDKVRQVIEVALAERRAWLSEAEAKSVLAAYGVPVVETRIASDPDAAGRIADELGGPVALKILSQDLTHKSDIGGVALDLQSGPAVREAAAAMLKRIGLAKPDARLEGFTVQQMVDRDEAQELIVGMVEDRQFGPVILFGQGGTSVEIVNDKALALAPLNMALARELMQGTRVFKLLQGYRGRPAVPVEDIALVLVKISHLVSDHPEILELDINPLLASARGIVALDARIRVAPATQTGPARLAIHPYPRDLEEAITLKDGREIFSRPIRPEDHHGLQAFFEALRPEDVRLRFFSQMTTLTDALAARLTQIDYDREMAFVATEGTDPGSALLGAVHILCDPDNERAEFAAMVRSDLKGQGLGYALMKRIIAYGRDRKVQQIFGDVMRENEAMLQMCDELGFERSRSTTERDVFLVTLRL